MKIWLCKHPIAAHYKEDQREAKRLASVSHAKIIDIRQAEHIDPALCEEPKLTPLQADKPKPKAKAKAKPKAKAEDQAEETASEE